MYVCLYVCMYVCMYVYIYIAGKNVAKSFENIGKIMGNLL